MGKDQELLEAARSGNVTIVEKILGQRAKRSGPLARWVSTTLLYQQSAMCIFQSKTQAFFIFPLSSYVFQDDYLTPLIIPEIVTEHPDFIMSCILRSVEANIQSETSVHISTCLLHQRFISFSRTCRRPGNPVDSIERAFSKGPDAMKITVVLSVEVRKGPVINHSVVQFE